MRKGLDARVELLRRFRSRSISWFLTTKPAKVPGSFRNVDLFIVDYTSPERTRKEMGGWLKANYPKVKIIALNPAKDQLIGADYNVVR